MQLERLVIVMADGQSDFEVYTASLPQSVSAGLVIGDAASTAFYRARRAGWDTEALVQDALAAVRRNGGPGVLVERLKTLAETAPARRSGEVGTRSAPALVKMGVEEYVTVNDPDGERHRLLRKIRAERPSPDEAERWMTELILVLRERHGSRTALRQPLMGFRR